MSNPPETLSEAHSIVKRVFTVAELLIEATEPVVENDEENPPPPEARYTGMLPTE